MSANPEASILWRRRVRQVHRWLGLLVAVQVLLWVCGGLIMSVLRIEAVHGDPARAAARPVALDAAAARTPLDEVLRREPEVRAVTLTTLLSRPVLKLETAAGPKLLDAATGAALSPISEALAREVALADYAGAGTLAGMDWVDTPELEFRGRDLPLWRARFDDARDTTLYISPATAQVVARRNDLWRVFDFVWMLHIMDYEEREDFNHPLLIAAAATALLFVFSGIWMLLLAFLPRRAPAP